MVPEHPERPITVMHQLSSKELLSAIVWFNGAGVTFAFRENPEHIAEYESHIRELRETVKSSTVRETVTIELRGVQFIVSRAQARAIVGRHDEIRMQGYFIPSPARGPSPAVNEAVFAPIP